MRKMRDEDRGFTLVELLLVLILLSGAGFVLLIKLPINFAQQHLDLSSTQLLEEIRDVRQAALAENNWYQVKFYPQDRDSHYQILRQGTKLKDIYLKDGVQFIGQPDDLMFNAAGRSVGATIILTNSAGQRRSVVVAPVGMRIREE